MGDGIFCIRAPIPNLPQLQKPSKSIGSHDLMTIGEDVVHSFSIFKIDASDVQLSTLQK